jgi:hypothetical protein
MQLYRNRIIYISGIINFSYNPIVNQVDHCPQSIPLKLQASIIFLIPNFKDLSL